MAKAAPVKRFSAVIVLVRNAAPKAINPCVVVPAAIVAALRAESGRNQALPVRGTLEGTPFKANVVRYLGAWRLYLNGSMRVRAGADSGDRVTVTLRHDPVPRRQPAPKAFTAALARDRRAKAAFAALAPSRRKDIRRYLGNLKREETLRRNIAKVLHYLRGTGRATPPVWLHYEKKKVRGR